MAKKRIHQIAKELDIASADILFHAKELGIEVKTASSGLTEDEEQLVKLSLFPETESDSATVEEVSESVDEKVETEELENNEIPYDNLSATRLAILATFAFYGLMHFLHGSKEVYPIHFLKTFLFMLSIMGLTVFVKGNAEVSLKQWFLLLFFFCVATTLHLTTTSRIRRFGKK